jgi:hypothetical protein
MSRIPRWIYVLFGGLAIVAGILGVLHAPSGLPKTVWGVICVLGAASLINAGLGSRRRAGRAKR